MCKRKLATYSSEKLKREKQFTAISEKCHFVTKDKDGTIKFTNGLLGTLRYLIRRVEELEEAK